VPCGYRPKSECGELINHHVAIAMPEEQRSAAGGLMGSAAREK